MSSEELHRQRLVQYLKAVGYVRSRPVEEAFSRVPRHFFVQEYTSPAAAYLDEVVPLRPGISTSSQPSVMALMLEALGVQPGERVLEVGTASGYGAALLAELVGKEGEVWTVELEEDLARRAERKLAQAGYDWVRVIAGDGLRPHVPPGSLDRLVVTAAVEFCPRAWVDQLRPGGVLVLPLAVPGVTSFLYRAEKVSSGGGATASGGEAGGPVLEGRFYGVPVAFVSLRRGDAGGRKGAAEPGRLEWGEAWRRLEGLLAQEGQLLSWEEELGLRLWTAWAALDRAGRGEKVGPADFLASSFLSGWKRHGRPTPSGFRLQGWFARPAERAEEGPPWWWRCGDLWFRVDV
ncbi:MAG: methyltransferase domain-containing protein [Bacillota bacterium]|nr:methyltransferase domain-containing protein [Bacillota bacterium]